MSLSRARVVVVGLVGVAALAWAAVGRTQSQVPGVPSPGDAPVRVVNEVAARAAQAGPWQVSLAPATIVGLAPDSVVAPAHPDFLKIGRRYLIAAGNGPAAVYTVDRIDRGWVRAVGRDGVRWLNLAQVVWVQDAS
jgi:hypothetical protein